MMPEEEFRKSLTEQERARLDELARSVHQCSIKGTYSFTLYWTNRIKETLAQAHERMSDRGSDH